MSHPQALRVVITDDEVQPFATEARHVRARRTAAGTDREI